MALTGEEKEIGMLFEAGLDDALPPPPQKQENTADGGDSVIRYRECLKNHAASIGGSVTDGCGEFMPSGEEGTPPYLKCAACNCHRQENPHGGEGKAPPPTPPVLPSFASMTHRNNAWASLAAQSAKIPAAFGGCASPTTTGTAVTAAETTVSTATAGNATNPAAATSATVAAAAATTVTVAGDSSCQDPANFNAHQIFGSDPPSAAEETAVPAKKRVRTKFTQEQKDKMAEFAETIGWRIPREEENIDGVERFCGEIGVKRQVFKVWMQNNKSSIKNNKSSHLQSTISPSSSSSINN